MNASNSIMMITGVSVTDGPKFCDIRCSLANGCGQKFTFAPQGGESYTTKLTVVSCEPEDTWGYHKLVVAFKPEDPETYLTIRNYDRYTGTGIQEVAEPAMIAA